MENKSRYNFIPNIPAMIKNLTIPNGMKDLKKQELSYASVKKFNQYLEGFARPNKRSIALSNSTGKLMNTCIGDLNRY